MRILLDECLPQRFGRLLTGHDVRTVQQMGWAGLKNGALLDQIGAAFDAFITVDKNLPAQQIWAPARSASLFFARARTVCRI